MTVLGTVGQHSGTRVTRQGINNEPYLHKTNHPNIQMYQYYSTIRDNFRNKASLRNTEVRTNATTPPSTHVKKAHVFSKQNLQAHIAKSRCREQQETE